jgi:hypothetical protein
LKAGRRLDERDLRRFAGVFEVDRASLLETQLTLPSDRLAYKGPVLDGVTL